MAKNIEEKLELVPMPAKPKVDPGCKEDETHMSACTEISVEQVEETGHDETNVKSDSISSQRSPSRSVQMPMAKNAEEKLELLPMPSKTEEDPGSNEVEPHIAATGAISVQQVEETRHESIRDTSDVNSPQPSSSSSVQMPNEGITTFF
jgi:hypothetical protein